MNGPVRSDVEVTAIALEQMSERAALARIAAWSDRCHFCDTNPASAGGILCSSCRVIQQGESE